MKTPEIDSDRHRTGDRRILLVEDNKVNQKVALALMSKLGYASVAADNGQQALEVLAGADFDLVIMDLQMPVLDGLEATRKIRAGEAGWRNRDIPIIAMTAQASRHDRQACLNAGMNGYMAKPISSERLREAIGKLSVPTAGHNQSGVPFNLADLIGRMNGDMDRAAERLEVFREKTETRLRQLAPAVHNYDFETVGSEAQIIAADAREVCAGTMAELAGELCRAADNKEQEYAASLVGELAMELAAILQNV